MTSIVSYRKFSDATRTIELRIPESADSRQRLGQELATLDGVTYVSLFDGAVLPEQPDEIAASVQSVELTDALRDEISAASPAVQLIRAQVVERIRARYSSDDEIKLLRVAPSDETSAWNAYVEDCRAWGRQQRALLGL